MTKVWLAPHSAPQVRDGRGVFSVTAPELLGKPQLALLLSVDVIWTIACLKKSDIIAASQSKNWAETELQTFEVLPHDHNVG